MNYRHVAKQIYIVQAVFIWSFFMWKLREESQKSQYTTGSFTMFEKTGLKTVRSITTAKSIFFSVYVIGTTCFDKYFYSM